MAYTEQQITDLVNLYTEWQTRSSDLSTAVLTRVYQHDRSHTLASHGLTRRLRTLERCMDRVFDLIDPLNDKPDRDAITDAGIFLQAFVINVFGAIDNLARLWVWEKGVLTAKGTPLPKSWIGLMPDHTRVRGSLSQEFQDYLVSADDWFKYLENYRHALAHRIPLYIPPKRFDEAATEEYRRLEEVQKEALQAGDMNRFGELMAEQMALGVFEPLMIHSFGPTDEDARPVLFHGQMVCDLATVVEIGEKMIAELETLPKPGA